MAISSVDPTQQQKTTEGAPAGHEGAHTQDRGFASILFGARGTPPDLEQAEAPECLHDLNLDQVIGQITLSREGYRLVPFFWTLLEDGETIAFRHEVLRDLEESDVRRRIDAFAAGMGRMRANLKRAADARYEKQRDTWFLQAVGCYCGAVRRLAAELKEAEPASGGLRSLAGLLHEFTERPGFATLQTEQQRVAAALAAIDYTIEIRGDRVRVDSYREEADYGEEIHASFERFRQGKVDNYRFRYDRDPAMNHIEAQILDLVANLDPEPFADLAAFRERNGEFLDATLERFDREVQFYLAYLDYIEPLRAAGLSFCEPEVGEELKAVRATDSFDLALATKLVGEGGVVITNDWELSGAERIFVVSGPNQGGKTTFARSFGQLHYLARLGLGVPGREARLLLSDRIFTHFERQEEHTNLSGKLEDDLVRVRRILEAATTRSVVVMNESFSSTALEDARLLGRRVLEALSELDLLCVYVTFVDELASLNEKTVSLTSMVDPEDPATRTFKVVRRPADGRAYAIAIAEKYRLTYEQLTERIGR
jgi:DNA mismatch repair protein MutS